MPKLTSLQNFINKSHILLIFNVFHSISQTYNAGKHYEQLFAAKHFAVTDNSPVTWVLVHVSQITKHTTQVEILDDGANDESSVKTSLPPYEDEGVWMKSSSYGSESGEDSVADPWSVQLSSDSDIQTTKWAGQL